MLAVPRRPRGDARPASTRRGGSRPAPGLYEELGWTWRVTTNNAPIRGASSCSRATRPPRRRSSRRAAPRSRAGGCGPPGDAGRAPRRGALPAGPLRRGRALGGRVRGAASDDASAQFSWRPLRAKVLARRAPRRRPRRWRARRPARRRDGRVGQRGDVLLDLAEVFAARRAQRRGGRSDRGRDSPAGGEGQSRRSPPGAGRAAPSWTARSLYAARKTRSRVSRACSRVRCGTGLRPGADVLGEAGRRRGRSEHSKHDGHRDEAPKTGLGDHVSSPPPCASITRPTLGRGGSRDNRAFLGRDRRLSRVFSRAGSGVSPTEPSGCGAGA